MPRKEFTKEQEAEIKRLYVEEKMSIKNIGFERDSAIPCITLQPHVAHSGASSKRFIFYRAPKELFACAMASSIH